MIESPLTVRLTSYNGDSYVDVNDLEFSSVARGGFETANFTVPAWVTSADPALVDEARVRVYDDAIGDVVWEGYLSLPGRTVDFSAGESWQVGAVGAKTVLDDRSRAFIEIDADLQPWFVKSHQTPGATGSSATVPTDDTQDALLMQFPAGQPIDNTAAVAMQYERLLQSGQRLGGVQAIRVSGVTNTNYNLQYIVRPVGTAILNQPFSTTPLGPVSRVCGTYFDTAQTHVTLHMARGAGGATTVATDDVWGAFYGVIVRALMLDQSGADITGSTYDAPYVLAHEVITDALWAFTNMIDIPGAVIESSFTHQIDQMAYPDGIRLSGVLDDIALVEPDIAYGAFESDDVTGLHRFACWQYSTDVRYEASTIDGWSSPGAESPTANRLTVFWTDKRGDEQSSTYTTTSAGLDQWGRVRDAEDIHLGPEVGSQAAADRIGDAYLAELNNSQSAGELTVARPILDRWTGRWVKPWEIQPGYLLDVTDLQGDPPQRLTRAHYGDSNLAATLTLGNPVYTPEELTAKEARRRTRKGGSRTPVPRA